MIWLSESRDSYSPRTRALVVCGVGPVPPEAGSVRTDYRGPCSGPVSARLFVCNLHGVSWGMCLNSDIHPPIPAVAPQSTFFVDFPYDLRKPEV